MFNALIVKKPQNLIHWMTGAEYQEDEDYLVVQWNGQTVFCKPESELSEGTDMIKDLMELSYYLGVLDGESKKALAIDLKVEV